MMKSGEIDVDDEMYPWLSLNSFVHINGEISWTDHLSLTMEYFVGLSECYNHSLLDDQSHKLSRYFCRAGVV